MHELTLWKKGELENLRRDIDLLFRRFRRGFGVPRSLMETTEIYRTDLSETEDTVFVEAKLPDIRPGDIQISVTEDTLSLKAETSEESLEKVENYQRIEKSSRSFSRSIKLPCRILPEEVKATFKDNVLKIELPKCRPKKARGISIEIK